MIYTEAAKALKSSSTQVTVKTVGKNKVKIENLSQPERACDIYEYLPDSQPLNPHLLIDELESNFAVKVNCVRDKGRWTAEIMNKVNKEPSLYQGYGKATEEGLLDAVQIAVLKFLKVYGVKKIDLSDNNGRTRK